MTGTALFRSHFLRRRQARLESTAYAALALEAGAFYVMETRARSLAKKSSKARVVAGKCLREAYRA